jgi:hypothetical protein
MIPKSGNRFSEKIMLKQKARPCSDSINSDHGLVARFCQAPQSLLDQPIRISLPSPNHGDQVFGERLAGCGGAAVIGSQRAGSPCRIPRGVERRTQQMGRLGIKRFFEDKVIHGCSRVWADFRLGTGHDLGLHPIAASAHVGAQISALDGAMSLDPKESHRDAAFAAFRAGAAFGHDCDRSGHVMAFRLGLLWAFTKLGYSLKHEYTVSPVDCSLILRIVNNRFLILVLLLM